MNTALDLFCAIGLGPSILLVVVGFLVIYLPTAIVVHAVIAAVKRALSRPESVSVSTAATSDQIDPLHGVRLTETHLELGGQALLLRDLRFVLRRHSGVRVVDRYGEVHQVCRYPLPANPRVVALADALEELLDSKRTRRAPAPSFRITARTQRAKRCPYCHDDLREAEVECRHCGAGHHAECFRAHGACAILACGPAAGTLGCEERRSLIPS